MSGNGYRKRWSKIKEIRMEDIEKNEELNFEKAKLQPFYHDLKNNIIEPEKIVIATQYFWDKWASILGPTLTVLIIRLRRYCYYNKITKEKRDWCYPDQIKLAREIGVSRYTIMRELERKIAEYFITRKKRYLYDDTLKKKVRASDVYYIAMDDPLIPEDENKLVIMAAEHILKQPIKNKEVGPKSQNATQVTDEPVDNSPPKSQNATHIYKSQNATTKISTLYNTNNVNNVSNANKKISNERILNNKSKVKCLIEDMVIQLEDTHSAGFFKKVAELCPENFIYRALAEVKEESSMGKIKKSKGACFTDKIKRLAKEAGIIVSTKKN